MVQVTFLDFVNLEFQSLKVADIVQDYDILEQAREDAITFVIEEEDSVAYKEIQEFIEQTSRETEEVLNG